MYNRIIAAGMSITRYSEDIARYTMMKHAKQDRSEDRQKVLKEGRKLFKRDGLSNLK